jgi:hypothetical protein
MRKKGLKIISKYKIFRGLMDSMKDFFCICYIPKSLLVEGAYVRVSFSYPCLNKICL